MSKLFIRHPKYRRISKELRPVIEQEIHTLVGLRVKAIDSPKELLFKEDYGDFDFIVFIDDKADEEKFAQFLRMGYLGKIDDLPIEFSDVSRNSDTYSLLYHRGEDAYHIDFNVATTEVEFNNKCVYFSNNIVSNFLGQFLHVYNIQSGHNGIFYIYKDSKGNNQRFLFETDFVKFYQDYFNLNLADLEFKSYDELIQFLTNVSFFPYIELYRHVNSSDKKRSIKLHGLLHDVFEHIMGMPDNPEKAEYRVELQSHHQAIVDEQIDLHERKLARNAKVKTIVEKFIDDNGFNDNRQKVYIALRPMLEEIIPL